MTTTGEKPLAWGILGTGNIARQFADGMAGAQRGKLVAVGSRASETAQSFAARFQIDPAKAYPSYQQLLDDPEVDAVYISLPNALHHQWTLKAFEAGKHVLCEKPLASTQAEAVQMFEAAHQARRLLVEAYMYRTHPLTRKVLDEINNGSIGELKLIRLSFCYYTANMQNIRFNKALSGGVLMDVGCYCIDFARLITGMNPQSITATANLCETGVDDLTSVTMVFPGQVHVSFNCGMRLQANNRASICGSEGYLEIPVPWKPPVKDAEYVRGYSVPPKMDGGSRPSAPPPRTFTVDATGPLYAMEADAFAMAVAGHAPAVTEEDSISNMKILDEIRGLIGLSWAG